MGVVTYQGIVEQGRVKLPAGAVLPENATVYVVVPGTKALRTAHFRSPHLADPAQAARLELEVVEESTDAGL